MNCLNKDTKKEKFKKYLIDLTATNHKSNMTSFHSVSRNNSFKSNLNAKIFSKAARCWFSVCCKGDVNVHE